MMKSSAQQVLSLILLSLLLTASYGYRGRLVGGKSEVPDVKTNTEVQELGRFSVEEYNLRRKAAVEDAGDERLEFREVVEAQRQVVSGIKYYLNIVATQNGEDRMFHSEVVVKPWLPSKQLLSFVPSFHQRF